MPPTQQAAPATQQAPIASASGDVASAASATENFMSVDFIETSHVDGVHFTQKRVHFPLEASRCFSHCPAEQ